MTPARLDKKLFDSWYNPGPIPTKYTPTSKFYYEIGYMIPDFADRWR